MFFASFSVLQGFLLHFHTTIARCKIMNKFNGPGGECLPSSWVSNGAEQWDRSRNWLYTLNVFPFHWKAQSYSLEHWIHCRKWHEMLMLVTKPWIWRNVQHIALKSACVLRNDSSSHLSHTWYHIILHDPDILSYVLFPLGELAEVVCMDMCLIGRFDTQQTDAQHVLIDYSKGLAVWRSVRLNSTFRLLGLQALTSPMQLLSPPKRRRNGWNPSKATLWCNESLWFIVLQVALCENLASIYIWFALTSKMSFEGMKALISVGCCRLWVSIGTLTLLMNSSSTACRNGRIARISRRLSARHRTIARTGSENQSFFSEAMWLHNRSTAWFTRSQSPCDFCARLPCEETCKRPQKHSRNVLQKCLSLSLSLALPIHIY